MNTNLGTATIPLLASCLMLTGCTSEQKAALIGSAVGIATGIAVYGNTDNLSRALATGAAAGAATYAVVRYIQKRKATQREQAICAQRAATYKERVVRMPVQQKPQSRYWAVETPLDHSTQSGTTGVMLWDSQANRLVSTDIYEIRANQAPGSVAKYDEYPAVFIAQ